MRERAGGSARGPRGGGPSTWDRTEVALSLHSPGPGSSTTPLSDALERVVRLQVGWLVVVVVVVVVVVAVLVVVMAVLVMLMLVVVVVVVVLVLLLFLLLLLCFSGCCVAVVVCVMQYCCFFRRCHLDIIVCEVR